MQISSQAPQKPLLRYFGGKFAMRKWIISKFPEHRHYAEPFSGAASILLSKPRSKGVEIINDLNGELINLFRVMQSPSKLKLLQKSLRFTLYCEDELQRSKDKGADEIERARRLLVRSSFGVEGAGTKPTKTGLRMGNIDLSIIPQNAAPRNCAGDWRALMESLEMIADRLMGVTIYKKDALDFISQMSSPDCLLYVDPPYEQETRSHTRYQFDLDPKGHSDLIDKLLESQSMVILSGYQSARYDRLIEHGWEKRIKNTKANMGAGQRIECLWISPNIQTERELFQ